jgi:RNA recognition motif-containing protein
MEAKFFIRNLSYDSIEDSLHTAFSQSDTVVTVDMIKDHDTGRMKGFGA